MELIADRVEVAGVRGLLLLPTSLRAEPRHPVLVAADPGYPSVALALAIGGRVPLAGGSVTLDGDPDPMRRRRHVSLVDVPDVTSPEDAVSVHSAVAEQLALAGRPSDRAATRAVLAAHGLEDYAHERFEALDATDRTLLLMDIAASRATTRVLVVAAPDRHGGSPEAWWRAAHRLASTGLTVVVGCSHATVRALGDPPHFAVGETTELEVSA
ncbi:hypothetical protein [Knoellia koreensis]|uniref:ABC transporter ATP-binding protein n=1 Tax=Knoellia koreensis TaxID=2730921 RepID=A0A849H7F2_9MICO|nr:hypothetical protein [Knoellia sp. DB2414S]NNM45686.1 hypothetical protein [Knoellia sp. DB2414S]